MPKTAGKSPKWEGTRATTVSGQHPITKPRTPAGYRYIRWLDHYKPGASQGKQLGLCLSSGPPVLTQDYGFPRFGLGLILSLCLCLHCLPSWKENNCTSHQRLLTSQDDFIGFSQLCSVSLFCGLATDIYETSLFFSWKERRIIYSWDCCESKCGISMVKVQCLIHTITGAQEVVDMITNSLGAFYKLV